ncbi:MAG: hypothetical protein ACLPY3_10820 [Solirubrobacteraceae bacterium]
MYTQLPAEMIHTRQEEIPARTIDPHEVQDVRADAPRSGRIPRRAGRAIAAVAVCVAATTVVAISDASANPQSAEHSSHVSASQLEREMRALQARGFVASSCEVGGTLMTNYRTNQSVLLSW